ncbi:MAG: PPC domain-containing DNA-binding protein [Candidatus Methanomethylicaceae archaeon]
MKIRVGEKELVIRLDENEEVISSIIKACLSERVLSGTIVSCIGALKKCRLILRKGLEKTISDHLEIVGNGNVSQYMGAPFVHLHLAAGGESGSWVGHLIEGVVDVYCEIFILKSWISMVRVYDKSLEGRGVTVPYTLEFGERS